jgi:hypothetical protein
MKKLIWLVFCLSLTYTVKAQYFTLKTNLPSFAFNNLSLTGELAFKSNASAALNLNYHYPKGTFRPNKTKDGFRFHLNGVYVTPEFRFYPQDHAPNGFYWGPYLRFGRLGSKWNGVYEKDTVTYVDYDVKLNLTEIGLGVQAGYQFILDNGFSIDLLLIGPRLSYFGFKGQIDGALDADAIFEIIDIEGLDENGFYGIGKSVFEWFTQSATIRVPITFPAYRIGISLGYTF